MVFFFKQKTAYEVRISDWSSDVCSSDLVLGIAAEHRTLGGAADGEEAVAIRQFDELRHDDAGGAERGVDVPHRAGAAVLGDVKAGRVEPFGHVARLVDAQEEEGHAPRPLPLQRGEPAHGDWSCGARGCTSV